MESAGRWGEAGKEKEGKVHGSTDPDGRFLKASLEHPQLKHSHLRI